MKNFNTTEYEFAHGKKPRGFGFWAFIPADSVWPKEMPYDAIAWEHGTYAEAKKEVSKKYPEIDYWKVLS